MNGGESAYMALSPVDSAPGEHTLRRELGTERLNVVHLGTSTRWGRRKDGRLRALFPRARIVPRT